VRPDHPRPLLDLTGGVGWLRPAVEVDTAADSVWFIKMKLGPCADAK